MIYMLVNFAVEVMVLLIIVRCFLSFIPHDPYHPILRFIYDATNPLLSLCAKVLPESLRYPLDLTPMIALVVLQMLILPLLLRIVSVLF